jgi:hypothetical protein
MHPLRRARRSGARAFDVPEVIRALASRGGYAVRRGPALVVGLWIDVEFPFDRECHVRWRRWQGSGALSFTIALMVFVVGLMLMAAGAPFGFRTACAGVALIGFPAFFWLAVRGPRCLEIRPDSATLWIPSATAAETISAYSPVRGDLVVDSAQKFTNKPLAAGALCSRHASVAACFACARCGAPGCRDPLASLTSPTWSEAPRRAPIRFGHEPFPPRGVFSTATGMSRRGRSPAAGQDRVVS